MKSPGASASWPIQSLRLRKLFNLKRPMWVALLACPAVRYRSQPLLGKPAVPPHCHVPLLEPTGMIWASQHFDWILPPWWISLANPVWIAEPINWCIPVKHCPISQPRLLADTWIVETLDVALRLAQAEGQGCRFVTLQGELVEPDGPIDRGIPEAGNRFGFPQERTSTTQIRFAPIAKKRSSKKSGDSKNSLKASPNLTATWIRPIPTCRNLPTGMRNSKPITPGTSKNSFG